MLWIGVRLFISIVSAEELDRLWSDNQMTEKRTASVLIESITWQGRAGDPKLLGVTSRIVKLLTAKGRHIGTIHDIVSSDGTITESHPHDYTFRDCSRVRRKQKQEQ